MKVIFLFFLVMNLSENIFSQDFIVLKGKKDTIKCIILEDKITYIKYRLINSIDTSIYQIELEKMDNYIVVNKNNIDLRRNKIDLNSNDVKDNSRFKNSIFFEAGGGNISLSLNYERLLIDKETFFINGRIGLGWFFIIKSATYSLSCNFGKKNNYLEVGIGWTNGLTTFAKEEYFSFFYPFVGYRFQKKIVFKANVMYFVWDLNHRSYPIFIGLGIGKAF